MLEPVHLPVVHVRLGHVLDEGDAELDVGAEVEVLQPAQLTEGQHQNNSVIYNLPRIKLCNHSVKYYQLRFF